RVRAGKVHGHIAAIPTSSVGRGGGRSADGRCRLVDLDGDHITKYADVTRRVGDRGGNGRHCGTLRTQGLVRRTRAGGDPGEGVRASEVNDHIAGIPPREVRRGGGGGADGRFSSVDLNGNDIAGRTNVAR